MKIHLSILLVSLSLLSACSKGSKTEVVPESVENQKSEVGPFNTEFTSADQTYRHNFKTNISQNEGQVEYYVKTLGKEKIQLLESKLTVSGCPASQVSHQTFWIPDSQKPNQGYQLFLNTVFESLPQVKGVVRHVIHGLQGCQAVELSTTLKKQVAAPALGPICQGTTASNSCRVKIYCKEKDPLTYFYEVEIWDRPTGQTLNQFMNHGDGTRGLMVLATVTPANDGTFLTYSGAGNQLKVHLATSNGIFQSAQGNPVELKCQIY